MQEKLENVHDMWNDKLFEEHKKSNKEKIVASFLGSFSSNKPELRSALSVFAIMQTFPNHKFVLRENQTLERESPCGIWNYPVDFWLGKDGIKKIAGLALYKNLSMRQRVY